MMVPALVSHHICEGLPHALFSSRVSHCISDGICNALHLHEHNEASKERGIRMRKQKD